MRELGFADPREVGLLIVTVGTVVGPIWTAVQAQRHREPWPAWAAFAALVPPSGVLVSPIGPDHPVVWLGYASVVSVAGPLVFVAVTRRS